MANGTQNNGGWFRSAGAWGSWLGWAVATIVGLLAIWGDTTGGAIEVEHMWNAQEHTRLERQQKQDRAEILAELKYIRERLDKLAETH